MLCKKVNATETHDMCVFDKTRYTTHWVAVYNLPTAVRACRDE